KPDDAGTAFGKALDIHAKLAERFPLVPAYRRDLAATHVNLGILLKNIGKSAAAEDAYNLALPIQAKLVAEFRTVPNYRVDLGATQGNIANLQLEDKRFDQALKSYSQCMETLEVEQLSGDARAQQVLSNAHWGRAETLDNLKRFDEAARAWNRALELSPEGKRMGVRMGRAASRVRAGLVDAAIQDVEEIAKKADQFTLYDAACVFALAADRPAESGGSLSKEECAQRAVVLLRQAVTEGYTNVEQMKKDDDLKALHERDDFKKLVAELEVANRRKP